MTIDYDLDLRRRENLIPFAHSVVDYATRHSSFLEYSKLAIEAEGFYDGSNPFLNEDLKTLITSGNMPVTANLIGRAVDTICGIELQNRYKSKIQVDSRNPEYRLLSDSLTYINTAIEEQNDVGTHNSHVLRDAVVAGMGWCGVSAENNRIKIKRVPYTQIIPDFDDISPQFTEMEYVIRLLSTMSPTEIRARWKEKVKDFSFVRYPASGTYSEYSLATRLFRQLSGGTPLGRQMDILRERNCPVEIQFKVPKKAFCGYHKMDGRYFETFDYQEAKKIAGSSLKIETKDSKEVRRLVFIYNTLLEYGSLSPSFPHQDDFTYIPCVFKKRVVDNVPVGNVSNAQALQMDFNSKLTANAYAVKKEQLILLGSKVPDTNLARLEAKFKSREGILNLGDILNYHIRNNFEHINENMKIMFDGYLQLIKRVLRVEDEMQGIQTNATSGLAQQVRQAASLRASAFVYDNFMFFKKRLTRMTIRILQACNWDSINVSSMDENYSEPIYLNLTYEGHDGSISRANDISFLPINVTIEEMPDFKTSSEAEAAAIEKLLQMGEYAFGNKYLLERLVNNPEEVHEGHLEYLKFKSQLENPQVTPESETGSVDQIAQLPQAQIPLTNGVPQP